LDNPASRKSRQPKQSLTVGDFKISVHPEARQRRNQFFRVLRVTLEFMTAVTLADLGEREVVSRLVDMLPRAPFLVGDIGNDAAALDIGLPEGDLLLVNTDRTGVNFAFQLELTGPACIGDLAVSHAVSDIYACGGLPNAVTIALLLPATTACEFVEEIQRGAAQAATRYGAFVVGGDTKHNSAVIAVVTALGIVPRKQLLLRSRAQPGDLVCVTGYLGDFLVAVSAARHGLSVPTELESVLKRALLFQYPPFSLAPSLAAARVPHSCTDISDGFPGAVHGIASASRLGALIDESQLPVRPEVVEFGRTLGLTPMQLVSAGGDWQFLYAIPPERIEKAHHIALQSGHKLSVVGEFTADPVIAYRRLDGLTQSLNRFEHDSFIPGRSGKSFFDRFGDAARK
jgi:thiamine-monophosphate kinase